MRLKVVIELDEDFPIASISELNKSQRSLIEKEVFDKVCNGIEFDMIKEL